MCVSMYVWGHTYAKMLMWREKDNFLEPLLPSTMYVRETDPRSSHLAAAASFTSGATSLALKCCLLRPFLPLLLLERIISFSGLEPKRPGVFRFHFPSTRSHFADLNPKQNKPGLSGSPLSPPKLVPTAVFLLHSQLCFLSRISGFF